MKIGTGAICMHNTTVINCTYGMGMNALTAFIVAKIRMGWGRVALFWMMMDN